MSSRIPVAVLGATGVVGQRFVARLARHPRFELRELCASERNAGKRFDAACAWRLTSARGPAYGGVADRVLLPAEPSKLTSKVVFSALDADVARELEPALAREGRAVFSNASAHRNAPDVPLLIPEVNAAHLELLAVQRRRWSGSLICNPNCTATVLTLALAPLHQAFGVEAVSMVSLQAISGAGYPGVAALDVAGNVLPWIRGEEDKLPIETAKMLGELREGDLRPAELALSASCTRVPVDDGHTLAVSLRLRDAPSPEQVREVWARWRPLCETPLPSAPAQPLRLHLEDDRPQPKRDVEDQDGMVVHIGRWRPCPVLGLRFVALGHNAERGAAGASVLNAELALARGWLD